MFNVLRRSKHFINLDDELTFESSLEETWTDDESSEFSYDYMYDSSGWEIIEICIEDSDKEEESFTMSFSDSESEKPELREVVFLDYDTTLVAVDQSEINKDEKLYTFGFFEQKPYVKMSPKEEAKILPQTFDKPFKL